MTMDHLAHLEKAVGGQMGSAQVGSTVRTDEGYDALRSLAQVNGRSSRVTVKTDVPSSNDRGATV